LFLLPVVFYLPVVLRLCLLSASYETISPGMIDKNSLQTIDILQLVKTTGSSILLNYFRSRDL